jgi:hypothetical protein
MLYWLLRCRYEHIKTRKKIAGMLLLSAQARRRWRAVRITLYFL